MNHVDQIIRSLCPDARERDAVSRIAWKKPGIGLESPSVVRRVVLAAKQKVAKEKKP